MLSDLILQIHIMLISVIKLMLNLQVGLFVRLEFPSELSDRILELDIVLLVLIFAELILLIIISQVEELILNIVIHLLKLMSRGFSLLEVSLKELVVDDQLINSFLKAHAVVFEFISCLGFVGQVLDCGLKSINFIVFINNHRVIFFLEK